MTMKTNLKDIAALTGALLKGEDREIEILLTDSRSLSDPAKSLFLPSAVPVTTATAISRIFIISVSDLLQ